MITGVNSEDRLVQQTFADHLEQTLGWRSVYAYNTETFGPNSLLGRKNDQEVVLVRELRRALTTLNPELPPGAVDQVVETLTRIDRSRSLVQHNRDFHRRIRSGVPVKWQGADGVD